MEEEKYQVAKTGNMGSMDQWLNVVQAIGRMEGKIDQLLSAQDIMKKVDDDHEIRLRMLEKGHWKQMGIFAAVGAVFMALAIPVLKQLGFNV